MLDKFLKLKEANFIGYTFRVNRCMTATIQKKEDGYYHLTILENDIVSDKHRFVTFELVLQELINIEFQTMKTMLHPFKDFIPTLKPNKIKDMIIENMVIDPVSGKIARIKELGEKNECDGYLYHGVDCIYAIYCENGLWFVDYENEFGFSVSSEKFSSFEDLLKMLVKKEKTLLMEAHDRLKGWLELPILNDEMIRDGIVNRIDV